MELKDGKTSPYKIRMVDGTLIASEDIERAVGLLARAEEALKYKLSIGEFRDLLKDNTDWTSVYCDRVAGYLFLDRSQAVTPARAAWLEIAEYWEQLSVGLIDRHEFNIQWASFMHKKEMLDQRKRNNA